MGEREPWIVPPRLHSATPKGPAGHLRDGRPHRRSWLPNGRWSRTPA